MSRNPVLNPRQGGWTLVQVLIASVVLGIGLAPALEALDGAVRAAGTGEDIAEARQRLAIRLETVAAEPYALLDAAAQAAGNVNQPASYSDPDGTPARLIVYLSRYDGDNADGNGNPFDGTDDGLLFLRVVIDNSPYELSTLIQR